MTESLSKVERLRIAAAVAPTLRRGEHRRAKPIKVVGADGVILREISSDEFAEKLLARAKIELDVEPDPSRCVVCNEPATTSSVRHAIERGVRAYCERHKRGPMAKKSPEPCAVCGEAATRRSSKQARRKGCKAYCEKHKRAYPLLRGNERLDACPGCGTKATTHAAAKGGRPATGSIVWHKGRWHARVTFPDGSRHLIAIVPADLPRSDESRARQLASAISRRARTYCDNCSPIERRRTQ